MDRYIYSYAAQRGIKICIAKAGRTFKYFNLSREVDGARVLLRFADLRLLMGGGSLAQTVKVLGVDKKYKLRKGFTPHSFYSSLERVHGSEVPPYTATYFSHMNSSEMICSEREYGEFVAFLNSGKTHFDHMVSYLKADVNVVVFCMLEIMDAYSELFGIEVLDSAAMTNSSLFFRQASLILPFRRGQPTFTAISESTALYMLLHSMAGGITMRMAPHMAVGDEMYPGRRDLTCQNIVALDFR